MCACNIYIYTYTVYNIIHTFSKVSTGSEILQIYIYIYIYTIEQFILSFRLLHLSTRLDTPRTERMKCDEMTSCYVMCHVMSARVVYGLATWPPFDSGLSTHTKPLGHDFANQKHGPQCVCCFPRCCVVTWNMVLKCLWRCVACSNIKPKEVSCRSVQFPVKKADKSKWHVEIWDEKIVNWQILNM